jgi:hypothetical protein
MGRGKLIAKHIQVNLMLQKYKAIFSLFANINSNKQILIQNSNL